VPLEYRVRTGDIGKRNVRGWALSCRYREILVLDDTSQSRLSKGDFRTRFLMLWVNNLIKLSLTKRVCFREVEPRSRD
jgi:hypothetical protein